MDLVLELDGEACVLCDGQRGGYPIIDGEGLLKQVWALAAGAVTGRDAPVKRKWRSCCCALPPWQP